METHQKQRQQTFKEWYMKHRFIIQTSGDVLGLIGCILMITYCVVRYNLG